jgi:hypothetical protein
VEIRLPGGTKPGALRLLLDGARVDTRGFALEKRRWLGTIPVAEGDHELAVELDQEKGRRLDTRRATTRLRVVAFHDPEACEVLNNVECLLPYPSSRFLEPAGTPTGFRLRLPASGMPSQLGVPLSPEPYGALDGFSPTAQILMHFPEGVDVEASGAPRLLESTRTTDLRSLHRDSPTVLLDLDSGERVLHWTETDAHTDGPERQVFFLRPGTSLVPGHRYAVAVRSLVRPDGKAVAPEPAFRALRDRLPTTIPAIEARRAHFEDLFKKLRKAGIRRDDLVLAFDFVVMSEQTLSGQMLSMRDQAFAWLAAQDRLQTFHVDEVIESDCGEEGTRVWRTVHGTFEVPLFLTRDPVADPTQVGFLRLDAAGAPAFEGVTIRLSASRSHAACWRRPAGPASRSCSGTASSATAAAWWTAWRTPSRASTATCSAPPTGAGSPRSM